MCVVGVVRASAFSVGWVSISSARGRKRGGSWVVLRGDSLQPSCPTMGWTEAQTTHAFWLGPRSPASSEPFQHKVLGGLKRRTGADGRMCVRDADEMDFIAPS